MDTDLKSWENSIYVRAVVEMAALREIIAQKEESRKQEIFEVSAELQELFVNKKSE